MFNLNKVDYKKLSFPLLWGLSSLTVAILFSVIPCECESEEGRCVCGGRGPISYLSWYYCALITFVCLYDFCRYHSERATRLTYLPEDSEDWVKKKSYVIGISCILSPIMSIYLWNQPPFYGDAIAWTSSSVMSILLFLDLKRNHK